MEVKQDKELEGAKLCGYSDVQEADPCEGAGLWRTLDHTASKEGNTTPSSIGL
jgi:hypothetical protein